MSNELRDMKLRLARLEREVQKLRETVANQNNEKNSPWWQQIAGQFENDRAFAEIVRLGRKLRKEDKEGKR